MRAALEQIAAIAGAAGVKQIDFGTDEATTAALAELAGARVSEVVHQPPVGDAVVNRTAMVTRAGVRMTARAHRSATEAEIAGHDDWMRHADGYLTRSLG